MFQGNDASGFIVCVLLVFAYPTLIRWSARKRWHAFPRLAETQKCVFSESGISTDGSSFRWSGSWANWTRAETWGPLIILYRARSAIGYIPLSALGDETKVDALKSLLREKVPDCRRLK